MNEHEWSNTGDSDVDAVFQDHILKGKRTGPSVAGVHGAVLETQYDMLMSVIGNRDREIERLRKALVDLPWSPDMKDELVSIQLANMERDSDLAYWCNLCKVVTFENVALKAKLEEHDQKESVWKRTLDRFKDVR